MPITPVSYSPRPYVRNGTMGDLLRLRGRNQADAELRAGEIQARMWSDLGQNIAGTMQGIQRERQEAPIRAQEAESRALALQGQRQQVEQGERLNRQDTAFMALLEKQPNPDPREVMSIYGPQRGMQIAQGLSAFGELQSGAVKDARDTAGRLAIGAKSLTPQLRLSMWPAIRGAAIKGGLGSEQDIPAEPSDDYLDAVIGWATGEQPTQAKTPTREIKVRNEDGSESIQIVEDAPGQTFTSAAAKPTNIDDAIMAAFNGGNEDEVKRLLRLKGQTAAATRAPEKPEDPLARRERELRVQKLEADLRTAMVGPSTPAKLEAVAPVLDEIETLSKRIFTTDMGPVTNIVGAWRRGAAALNMDNDVREYRSLVRGFTPLMARAVGHNGVLTEQDVQRTEMLFGDVGFLGTDNKTVADNKIARLKTIMVGGGSDEEKAELRRLMGWDGGGPSAGGSGGGRVYYDADGNPK